MFQPLDGSHFNYQLKRSFVVDGLTYKSGLLRLNGRCSNSFISFKFEVVLARCFWLLACTMYMCLWPSLGGSCKLCSVLESTA